MAINVNTVYQTVLLILNKEQRGYMTPVEFNKTGAQAQLEIFETYFDSLNQQIRVPQTDADYANRVVNLDEKISIFKKFGDASSIAASNVFGLPGYIDYTFGLNSAIQSFTVPGSTPTTYTLTGNALTLSNNNGIVEVFLNGVELSPNAFSLNGATLTLTNTPTANDIVLVNLYANQFYKLGQVLYNPSGVVVAEELQRVLREELYHLLSSDLTAPNTNNPIYLYENHQLTIYPTTITSDIEVAYIRKPVPPTWNFQLGLNNQYIFNPSTSFNFELNPTEQTELILKILLYAGVVVKSPEIVQVASQQVQQENINQQR